MGDGVGGHVAPVRSSALALAALGLLAVGWLARERWPSALPALDCAPASVRLVDAGGSTLATCAAAGQAPTGAAALALGLRLDLNRASAAELAALPGVGRSLARRIVQARAAQGGRFRGWQDVDDVPGVGEATLRRLQGATELR